MLQGVCVKADSSELLKSGERYFLFPNGPEHYYVSSFPNQDAHRGCYHAERFEIVTNQELHKEKLYKAQLVYREQGYKGVELGEYFLKVKGTHANFYKDSELSRLRGCFPLGWFSNFEEVPLNDSPEEVVSIEEVELEEIYAEPEPTEYEQLSLF